MIFEDPWFWTLLFMIVVWCIVVPITEIRRANRQVPDVKIFKEDFDRSIQFIRSACNHEENGYVTKIVEDVKFKVRAVEDVVLPGIEYSTIPRYKSFTVYIDGEAVCREHILERPMGKSNVTVLEFTHNRPRNEIIRIITETGNKCMEIMRDIENTNKTNTNNSFFN